MKSVFKNWYGRALVRLLCFYTAFSAFGAYNRPEKSAFEEATLRFTGTVGNKNTVQVNSRSLRLGEYAGNPSQSTDTAHGPDNSSTLPPVEMNNTVPKTQKQNTLVPVPVVVDSSRIIMENLWKDSEEYFDWKDTGGGKEIYVVEMPIISFKAHPDKRDFGSKDTYPRITIEKDAKKGCMYIDIVTDQYIGGRRHKINFNDSSGNNYNGDISWINTIERVRPDQLNGEDRKRFLKMRNEDLKTVHKAFQKRIEIIGRKAA